MLRLFNSVWRFNYCDYRYRYENIHQKKKSTRAFNVIHDNNDLASSDMIQSFDIILGKFSYPAY